MTGLTGVITITAGDAHTCALTSEGVVKCWGWNDFGQLGDGTMIQRTAPVIVSGLTISVSEIIAGRQHTCALTSVGGVKCWGNGTWGQLGNGANVDKCLTPVNASGLISGVTGLAAGEGHTCALTSGGGVKCWGLNKDGQVGDGTTTNRNIPIDVSGLISDVIAIEAGWEHTCALTNEGGVKCWGNNGWGQLGDGTAQWRYTPTGVIGLASGVMAIAAGGGAYNSAHTCAVLRGGEVKCWGLNDYGQLGDGTTAISFVPVYVRGFGSWYHVYYLPLLAK